MCILFTYINPSPQQGGFKVVIASNRDEMYVRPAKAAHQWQNHDGVYGGLDMQPGKEGGTWLAVNKYGRIGVLLNIGQKKDVHVIDPKSGRGFYAVEWVTKMNKDMKETFDSVKEMHNNLPQPFRLVTIETSAKPAFGVLTFEGNQEGEFLEEYLPPGCHTLGNNAPGVLWNKVVEGQSQFERIIESSYSWSGKEQLLKSLIDMLTSKNKHWPDAGIAEQMEGKPETMLKCLSAIFVHIPETYGTRTQSVILIGTNNEVLFYERTMEGSDWLENKYEFTIETPM